MDEKIKQPKQKTGGRVKGTPNKRTVKFSEALDQTGFDLAAEAVNLFRTTEDQHLKHKLLIFMANFSVPVPKSVEPTPEDPEQQNESLSNKTSEDLIQLIRK